MNAPFSQLSLVQCLEREGIARGAAEAIAGGIEDAPSELVTGTTLRAELEVVRAEAKAVAAILRADFDILRGEFAALRGEFAGLRGEFGSFKEEVRLTLELNCAKFELRQNRLVVRLGGLMFALAILVTAVLGTIIALK